MSFKPMLAGKCTDVSKLKYPVLASLKLDGVRCIMVSGKLMSRTLKPIPNHLVQEVFKDVPDGSDGELIIGDPTAFNAYRKTVSAVMGDGNDISGLRFYVFDNFKYDAPFVSRHNHLMTTICELNTQGLEVLSHRLCIDEQELNDFEAKAVDAGHEGVMVRSLGGPYKQGRSTEKEGYLLKIKRFEDAEAEVTGFEERMHNGNSATTNALGRTERSSHKENLIGRGDLGALTVKGLQAPYKGVEFNIGSGFDDEERMRIWQNKSEYVGKIVKFRYFPLGSKDRPRFPTFEGIRDERDM